MAHSITISNDINFLAKRNLFSIQQYKECLEKYSENFEKEISLTTNAPIFLDTNILLRYYSISITAREKLFKFIEKNKKRIILTNQVQFEFIKNREDVIQRFFEQVTKKIPTDFNTDVVNKMKSFIETHKVVLKDYPFVESGINKHRGELEEILKKLNENVEFKRKELLNLIVNDVFLDLLNSCKQYESLSEIETKIVKDIFDKLSSGVKADNLDVFFNKSNSVFPGLGDIKLKPDDPYGDFIIYHEIMKFMLNEKRDCVFLTFDNSKGDWMNKSKSPYTHYVLNMYSNTGNLLYIIDAERTLEEMLDVNIDSLVHTEVSDQGRIIDLNSLNLFMLDLSKIFNIPYKGVSIRIVDEITLNGFTHIGEIYDVVIKVTSSLTNYLSKNSTLNSLGALRAALKIYLDEYIQISQSGKTVFTTEDLSKYHAYRE